MQYGAAFILTVFASAIAVGVDSRIAIPNVSLVYVIPVVVAGAAFGMGPSLFAALLGALSYNYFLTDPRYTFTVDDPANIWAIGLLFLVGLIVSGVAFVSNRKASEASEWQRQAVILQRLSTEITATHDLHGAASAISGALATLFAAPVVVMLAQDGQLHLLDDTDAGDMRDADLQAAHSALAALHPVRGGVYPDQDSRFDFWPVITGGRALAVIGIAFAADERPPQPDVTIDVVRNLFALAVNAQRSDRMG